MHESTWRKEKFAEIRKHLLKTTVPAQENLFINLFSSVYNLRKKKK